MCTPPPHKVGPALARVRGGGVEIIARRACRQHSHCIYNDLHSPRLRIHYSRHFGCRFGTGPTSAINARYYCHYLFTRDSHSYRTVTVVSRQQMCNVPGILAEDATLLKVIGMWQS